MEQLVNIEKQKQKNVIANFNQNSNLKAAEETKCQHCSSKTNKKLNKATYMKVCFVIIASLCTAYVCLLSSRRYFNSWVQTVIDRTDVHISEIPFPAVTICPVKGLNLLRLENQYNSYLNQTLQNYSIKELHDFNMLLNSMNDILWPNIENVMDIVEAIQEHVKYSNDSPNIENFLQLLAVNFTSRQTEVEISETFDTINLETLQYFLSFECEDIFAECRWRRQNMPCCTLFRKIQTYRGVCYTFNSILAENPNPTWPWIVSESGLGTALTVGIKRSSFGKYYEKIAAIVHDPQEMGFSDIIYMDHERVDVNVSPLKFTADSDIRSIKPEIRHCYFTNELKLLGKSTFDCVRNCRVNYIEQKCNCTYFFPLATRSRTSNTLPICKASNIQCIYKYKDVLLSTGNIIEEVVEDVQFSTWDCKCYPNCNFVQYQTTVNTDRSVISARRTDYIDFQVQYQHHTLFSYRSSLRFTLLDLIVSYGGIAGLFLGLSLLGIIEVLHDLIMCWKQKIQKKVSTQKEATTQGMCDERQEETKAAR